MDSDLAIAKIFLEMLRTRMEQTQRSVVLPGLRFHLWAVPTLFPAGESWRFLLVFGPFRLTLTWRDPWWARWHWPFRWRISLGVKREGR